MGEQREVNKLDNGETLRTGAWLLAQCNRLKQESVTYAGAAEQASKELGFSVSDNNVKKLAKDLKLEWQGDPQAKGGIGAVWAHLNPLEVKVEKLEKAVAECEEFILKQGAVIDQLQAKCRQLQADADVHRGLIAKAFKRLGESLPNGFHVDTKPAVVGR